MSKRVVKNFCVEKKNFESANMILQPFSESKIKGTIPFFISEHDFEFWQKMSILSKEWFIMPIWQVFSTKLTCSSKLKIMFRTENGAVSLIFYSEKSWRIIFTHSNFFYPNLKVFYSLFGHLKFYVKMTVTIWSKCHLKLYEKGVKNFSVG